jgi:thiamine-phosphate pyrophosphorylase
MPQLYAIAASMPRARMFLEAGVPVIQVRFKDAPLAPHAAEIRGWSERYPATRVIVNDDLDFAEQVGAWGVHLGQEDVRRYSRERLLSTDLQVGISTHSDEEIAFAKTYRPALLGFGPIFPTSTKATGHAPQGVARLAEVVRTAGVPIIAIGGITDSNLDGVAGAGCAYVAMISYLDRYATAGELRAFSERLELLSE